MALTRSQRNMSRSILYVSGANVVRGGGAAGARSRAAPRAARAARRAARAWRRLAGSRRAPCTRWARWAAAAGCGAARPARAPPPACPTPCGATPLGGRPVTTQSHPY